MTPLAFVLPSPAGLLVAGLIAGIAGTGRGRVALLLSTALVSLHLLWTFTAFPGIDHGPVTARLMALCSAAVIQLAPAAGSLLRHALAAPPRRAVIITAAVVSGWIASSLPLALVCVHSLLAEREVEARMRAAAAYAPVVTVLLSHHTPQDRIRLMENVVQPAQCQAYGTLLSLHMPSRAPNHCRKS